MTEKRERSRAEIVRMRRRQQSQKRLTHSSELAFRPLPPVTSREGLMQGATLHGAQAHARRRFQASLTLPGIQVHRPSVSVPRPQVGWRLASLFLCILLGGALYLAWSLPTFQVIEPLVSGNQHIPSADINAVLSITGQPIFTLIPSDLETRLRLNFPELASADVQLRLLNVVSVAVTERQPVIIWELGGAYTWIDDSGVALRPRDRVDNLIVVSALGQPAVGEPLQSDPLAPIPYISADLVKAIKTLAPSVPSGSSLIYDPVNGLGWSDSRGWKAYFGSTSKDMLQKIQVYQALVGHDQSLYSRGTGTRREIRPHHWSGH